MASLLRFVIPGQLQHIMVRGNNREPIFYPDEDYQYYLEKLKLACDKHQCDLHARGYDHKSIEYREKLRINRV